MVVKKLLKSLAAVGGAAVLGLAYPVQAQSVEPSEQDSLQLVIADYVSMSDEHSSASSGVAGRSAESFDSDEVIFVLMDESPVYYLTFESMDDPLTLASDTSDGEVSAIALTEPGESPIFLMADSDGNPIYVTMDDEGNTVYLASYESAPVEWTVTEYVFISDEGLAGRSGDSIESEEGLAGHSESMESEAME